MRSAQAEPISTGEELIRVAQAGDAEAIGQLIRASIRDTMAAHYSAAFIERQCAVWSGSHVGRLMQWPDRVMLVATRGREIVGTACLAGNSVRKVFVAPQRQRAGVGRRLIERLTRTAIGCGVHVLHVQSTINAAGFYARMGFWIADTALVEGEPFVVMQKNL
jgi:N-acetylglutamate synthase-like GNAT family acetyltransferase